MNRLLYVLSLLTACAASDPGDDTDLGPDDRPFERVPDTPAADVLTDRLCVPSDDRGGRVDPEDMDCDKESYRFADDDAAPDGPVLVMAFNIERGLKLDAILQAFDDGDLPIPDILLASELDRGCSRTGGRDVTREIAEHLGMDGVFGVEFVELPRESGAGGRITDTCEHGNAVFSRFPLGNVGARFHEDNVDWYLPSDQRIDAEPRLGGRSLVWGDAKLGDRLVRLVTVHFESRPTSWDGTQASQAAEAAEQALAPGGPAILGGDTNFPAYTLDLSRDDGTIADPGASAILSRGFDDAHAALPLAERGTRSGLVIDLIFGHQVTALAPGVCAKTLCDTLSDHQAVWASFTLE